jgi:hypothetical protein
MTTGNKQYIRFLKDIILPAYDIYPSIVYAHTGDIGYIIQDPRCKSIWARKLHGNTDFCIHETDFEHINETIL